MIVQSQVKRSLVHSLDEVSKLIQSKTGVSRTAIADELCDRFGFFDAQGNRQQGTCLKALRDLERMGHFTLPAARSGHWQGRSLRRLERGVPLPIAVPSSVESITDLSLRLVTDEQDYRIWNELVSREHPLGERPLVGRQLRYLIVSEHGFLGAIGFSSSALRLTARERWIGWADDLRRAHLDKVVCMSRFLIRPQVRCTNLASKILSMVVRIFPVDFECRYGLRPWLLETFVEKGIQTGSCYQAANWSRIGHTCGRGRQDCANRNLKSIKDIYIYVLDKNFRDYLGLGDYDRHPALAASEGIEGENWAVNELGEAELGDKRLTNRLISIAQVKGASPGIPFLETVAGDCAAVAGYYRFIDKPADSEVSMQSILAAHQQRTLRRMKAQREVLCIHDTSDLNYASLTACNGLGVIGKNQTKTESRGLRLHSSLAVTAAEGLPLGILNWKCYARELKPEHKGKDARYIAIEEKETYRWITSLDTCMTEHKNLPDTDVIHVMDREGDFFELFHHWNERRHGALLVRAKHNRRGSEGKNLFDNVAETEVKAQLEVAIPRKSARGKKGSKGTQPAVRKRCSVLSLRWIKTQILPPRHGLCSKKPSVDVYLLHAKEEDPPNDVKNPIEWFLLTTLDIDNAQTAKKVLEYYAKRWRIEDWHRILKTCCRVEEPAHHDAECLKRLIAINMVIAWRIHLMTLLGREAPELSMAILFSDLEITVLKLFAKRQNLKEPSNLGAAVLLVAKMGGYLNRKNDYPPGAEVLWRGLKHLTLLCEGVELIQRE